jgi:tripartite-type tricarboxylate transporter receptor subunit TctC
MKERLATLGAEAMPDTPEAFAAFVKAEMAKYREIVRASGAKAD